MPIAPFLTLANVAMAVGTGASVYYGQKSATAQRNAFNLQKQQADLVAARNRRDEIRAGRLRYAQAEQAGVNQGVGNSSSAEGGLGSIFSQLNANLSFLDQSKALGDQASVQLGRAAVFENFANTARKVTKGGVFLANNPDIIDKVKSVFSSPPRTPPSAV